MTLAVLRALHAIIGDALEDIDTVYSAASLSSSPCPSPSPSSAPPSTNSSSSSSSYSTHESSHPQRRPGTPPLLSNNRKLRTPGASPRKRSIDFPALDAPADSNDDRDAEGERLRAHPTVANAISRIVAACGQLSVTVRSPFLVLCDAGMGYHLPSALRFLEAAHIPELLSQAGPDGLHVSIITARLAPYLSNPAHPRTSGMEEGTEGKVAHILRLLATHHLLLERSPDVFALNRVSALLDTGKDFSEVVGCPEKKYENTDGIAAFFALNTDELFKASAYLTESILPHAAPLEEEINRTLLPLSPPLGQSLSKSTPNHTTTPETRSDAERKGEGPHARAHVEASALAAEACRPVPITSAFDAPTVAGLVALASIDHVATLACALVIACRVQTRPGRFAVAG
ncbi:hypothetical protein EWM64_g3795 [Hericium alpestre]|uniref:Uncharacterized protein n=1 Tax=Hericium alpestre TaxID=135208 RepID=A0A4Z0A1P2_9AGAM|nr:hypothetical protein EWM64_g3795 [Hericium alpestre]